MSNYTLLQGDCIEVMRTLPANSVQCVVTSPPYFGLRDYQTATWEGGDAACDHKQVRSIGASTLRNDGRKNIGTQAYEKTAAIEVPYRDICGKCGARRIDNQIGLEDSPESYVAKLVEVFREVRRVLRDDGTVFLNLGDSYSGSGGGHKPEHANPGLSRSAERGGVPREQLYGNGDKAIQGYQDRDSTSQSLCDARIDELMSHIERTGVHPVRVRVAALYQRIQACMAELRDHLPTVDSLAQQSTWLSSPAIEDRVRIATLSVGQLHAFLASTQTEFLPPLQGGFRLLDIVSLCLSSLHSLMPCVREYAHMLDASSEKPRDNSYSVSLFEQLAHHIRCIDGYCSLVFSWLNPPQVQPQYTTGLLKPKDLIGIPWLVAFALRADGWYLRSEIIWHKKAPMPESVRDRPTKAHEQVFLLSKNANYFYDAEAIAEPAQQWTGQAATFARSGPVSEHVIPGQSAAQHRSDRTDSVTGSTRNKRSVWTLGPESYSGAHFATMPTKLVEPCILAGTSAHGCCAQCGAPWERVVEREQYTDRPGSRPLGGRGEQPSLRAAVSGPQQGGRYAHVETLGWQPTCLCGCADVVPCTVLDPFNGSGTTGAVALKHGRRYVGIDLNADYLELAHERIGKAQPLLFEVSA